jgi:hypothetical protein
MLFLYSSLSFGVCHTSGLQLPLDGFIDEMSPIIEKPWSAATDEQVTKYKCQKRVLNLDEMKTYLNSRESLDKSIDLLLNKKGGLISEPIKTDLSLYGASNCKTQTCIAQKVFGEEQGIKLLYMMEKYGLNGSHLVHEDTKPWSSKALSPYLEGLAAVPDFMLPIEENKQFTKSSTVDSRSIADASITFHSGIDEFSDTRVAYTTFHEIAHYISGSLHIEDDEDWMKASGWVEKPKKFTPNFSTKPLSTTKLSAPKLFGQTPSLGINSFSVNRNLTSPLSSPTTYDFKSSGEEMEKNFDKLKTLLYGMKNDKEDEFISGYAKTNPLEDIAESVVAYRFNSEEFSKLSPERYKYVKDNIFFGVEFKDDSNCNVSPLSQEQYQNKLKN